MTAPPTTLEDARTIVVAAIVDIAPDLEPRTITPDRTCARTSTSTRWTSSTSTAALSERLGADIPERDYPLMQTVEGCAAYLLGGRA